MFVVEIRFRKIPLLGTSCLVLAGALAGAMECVVVQPFDLVKTRFQLNPGANAGISTTLANLVREGGFRR